MEWLEDRMHDHSASVASIKPMERSVSFRRPPACAAKNVGIAVLDLVHQVAELVRSAEDHATETQNRAQSLAARAVEELKFSEARAQASESQRSAAEAALSEANDRAQEAEEMLEQAEARSAALETQITTLVRRANAAELRASEAENTLRRVEDAIRTEILGQRHATVSNFAVAA
jgi:DNA repair exonuclease SbcCD ATPase subunit